MGKNTTAAYARYPWIVLSVCACIAFFLRFYLFPDNLFFGPEQGKDFWVIKGIATDRDFTLIGPKTDFDGVFHGPLYYYLAAIPFAATGGDPAAVMFVLAAIQSLTVFAVYGAIRELTKSHAAGIAGVIVYTTSFGMISYSRWLSGQQLAIPLGFLILWVIGKILGGDHRLLPVAAVILGLLGQVQFINIIFSGVFVVYLFLRIIWTKTRSLLPLFAVSVFLWVITSWGNFFLFDLRHDFLIAKSVTAVAGNGHGYSGLHLESWRSVMPLFTRWVASFTGFPSVTGYALTIGLFTFLIYKRKSGDFAAEVLLVALAVPLIILEATQRGGLDQVFVIIGPVVILAIAWLIASLTARKTIAFTGLLFITAIFNTTLTLGRLPTNTQVFFQAPQPDLRYTDEKKVIDTIYARTGAGKFSIQSYTIPFFWQDGWTYLFWYFGTKFYDGNLPRESGAPRLFVIIQDTPLNQTHRDEWYNSVVTTWGERTWSQKIGIFTVEERVPYSVSL